MTVKEIPAAKPGWLKKRISLNNTNILETKELLTALNLNTVCQSAKCPNIFECFSKKTATFMLLGNICTRNCAFCGVSNGKPGKPDVNEPENVAEAAYQLNLRYVVLTSVTRDDMNDGGASCFYNTVIALKKRLPKSKVECLIPDFGGNIDNLKVLLNSNPDVLNHNIETVESKYEKIRQLANYKRSLDVLKNSKSVRPDILTKTGFMLGLGETMEEIEILIRDIKEAGCDILTIGQYLQPSKDNFPVQKYYSPEEFDDIKKFADNLSFKYVVSGAYVRSSYHASTAYQNSCKL